jgi:hypothetical protein
VVTGLWFLFHFWQLTTTRPVPSTVDGAD